jgi:hypothetical protein
MSKKVIHRRNRHFQFTVLTPRWVLNKKVILSSPITPSHPLRPGKIVPGGDNLKIANSVSSQDSRYSASKICSTIQTVQEELLPEFISILAKRAVLFGFSLISV